MRSAIAASLAVALLLVAALSGCLAKKLDTDGDGITDDKDTDDDNDGMPDTWEKAHALDGKNATDAKADLDGDGLTNLQEYLNGTDPKKDDTDSDGMPDGWEVRYHLSPANATDAVQDPDGDGLSNLNEFRNSTAPNMSDSDGDLMPDGYEVAHGLLPLDPSDAALDPDGDGLTNRQESNARTDPNKRDTDGDGVLDGRDVAPLSDVAIKVGLGHLKFADMVEGAIDNPAAGKAYEMYVRVTVAGVEVWTPIVRTLVTELDLNLSVIVNIPDDLWNVSITIELWENDTEETQGLNADDQFDIDGTGPDLACDILYDMLTGHWTGDTTAEVTDGHADGLPPDAEHPDAALGFTVAVVPAPA